MMDNDHHMETDFVSKKIENSTPLPAAKSELLQNKNRLITMVSQNYTSKKAD